MSGALTGLFERLGDALAGQVRNDEWLSALLDAERSDFARFNHAVLRQAGTVERATLRLRLVDELGRQAVYRITIAGIDAPVEVLRAQIDQALLALREALAESLPDPWLALCRETDAPDGKARPGGAIGAAPGGDPVAGNPGKSAGSGGASGFSAIRKRLLETVAQAHEVDLVGFYAAGPVARGLLVFDGNTTPSGSMTPSRALWVERPRATFDFSIHRAGAAAKATWTGPGFDRRELAQTIERTRQEALWLDRPVKRLRPDTYRVWLSPRAVADLFELMGWNGFSARAHHAGRSMLSRLRQGESRFSSSLQVAEDQSLDLGAPFQADGYRKPERVPLIESGRWAGALVSPRTAREYGLAHNGASDAESPESLRVAPGLMPHAEALARLGTGIAVSNFWYLNVSDRASARVTGMTRFATFWVEQGAVVGPLEPMRFDDSLYRILGSSLEALGDRTECFPNLDTYEGRGLGGLECPGALIAGMRFTL